MPKSQWSSESSADVLRFRPLKRLTEIFRDREFLYDRYGAFLDRLADQSRYHVAPLRAFADAPSDRVVFGLRHDVDLRLDSALHLARMEHSRGLSATYFMLHSAPYYGALRSGRFERNPHLLPALHELQALGHEVGLHNDLVTLQCVAGGDARRFLADELEWLRANGIDVVGTAAHGSHWCHALGFNNYYFFSDWQETLEGFPGIDEVDGPLGRCAVPKGRMSEFALEYEAYHLPLDRYYSDSTFDSGGRRWHPDELDLASLERGERAVALVHPCHWDVTVWPKMSRLVRRVPEKLRERSVRAGSAFPR